jgi:hypothetical protein
MRNEWEFWNRWARPLEKREQSGAPNARVCRSRSLRRSIGFGNRVAVALDWRWAYVAFQRGARPIADVRESLGPARPVTDSLKSQFSTRDHPYECVIFSNKLMKQRCPDMSHQGERQDQADHAVQCSANILSESDLSDGQMGSSSNIQSTMIRAP